MAKEIPKHLAIIPDGNRRWAKEKGLIAVAGHIRAGTYKNLKELFNEAKNLGVKYISFWGFSTENWKRNKNEIDKLFEVISKGLDEFLEDAHNEKVGFRHLGRKDRMPVEVLDKLEKLEEETKNYRNFTIFLCLDYGGREEIVGAVNKILQSAEHPGDISEKSFSNYLGTKEIPEPDLIVRTGGEWRLSGFMPFQSIYSELYFTDLNFPDFGKEELRGAVEEYGRRKRRFGK